MIRILVFMCKCKHISLPKCAYEQKVTYVIHEHDMVNSNVRNLYYVPTTFESSAIDDDDNNGLFVYIEQTENNNR